MLEVKTDVCILSGKDRCIQSVKLLRSTEVTGDPEDGGKFDMVIPSEDGDLTIRGDIQEFKEVFKFFDGFSYSQAEAESTGGF